MQTFIRVPSFISNYQRSDDNIEFTVQHLVASPIPRSKAKDTPSRLMKMRRVVRLIFHLIMPRLILLISRVASQSIP